MASLLLQRRRPEVSSHPRSGSFGALFTDPPYASGGVTAASRAPGPFAGSGTALIAAAAAGFRYTGVEMTSQ